SPEELARHGIEVSEPLWAMMPDVKTTFDRLVERFAPDSQRREAILRNQIYEHFSTALAGSLEYAAVERLYEVYSSGRYDLIVLDTPPSRNALDFLDAPSRITDFLEQESLQWLVKPYSAAGRFSVKLLDLGSSFIMKTLGRLAGADTLKELAEFVMSFQGMYDGFRERSQAVKDLLASQEVAFVLVGSTQPNQRDAMLQFREDLQREGIQVRAVVLNRVRPPLELSDQEKHSLSNTLRGVLNATEGLSEQEIEHVVEAAEEEVTLEGADRAAIDSLKAALGALQMVMLPELRTDVRDLESLAQLYGEFLP
ncbi:MAG: ArsA-related P-loop ATPase, partial [Myxococcota bacterium]